MRFIDRVARLLIAVALLLAAPALVGPPAMATAPARIVAQQDGHSAAHAAKSSIHHDCSDTAPAPASHHATPDCVVCCCALPALVVAPMKSRGVALLPHVEAVDALASLSQAPPAPPPRG